MAERQIKIQDVGKFGIDENNRLYWDGKVVQTESVIVLSGKQSLLAILVAIAAILSAVSSAASAGASIYQLLSAKGSGHATTGPADEKAGRAPAEAPHTPERAGSKPSK